MKFTVALSVLLALESTNAFSPFYATNQGRLAFVQNYDNNGRTMMMPSSTSLWGIMDEIQSDAFDLSGSSSATSGDEDDIEGAYEMMLGELVFSTNDPRVDIYNKLDLVADPAFLTWLDNKIETSKDPDERTGLRDLMDMIMDVKTKVEVNLAAEEREAKQAEEAEQQRLAAAEAEAEAGRAMSNEDVLRKAVAIDSAETEKLVEKTEKKSFIESEITPEVRLSYEGTLKKVLPPYKEGTTPASIVYNYYDQFDAQFVKLLTEMTNGGNEDAKALLEALAVEQQNKIQAATETLQEVLSMGDPMKMEGAVVRLAREGKINEPWLLLVEANENQAREAGATGPAEVMGRLRKKAQNEMDKRMSSKEIVLIRQLLREDDAAEREKILEEAFTPKEQLLMAGTEENIMGVASGEVPEQEKPMPDVPPPDFIDACKAVTLNFGNLGLDGDDRGDLAARIKKIAAEAEVVATRIYGKGMSLREQQDRAWKEETTSVFDLEKMELQAESQGEKAPWASDSDDDMLLPGFDANGRMQVGGS